MAVIRGAAGDITPAESIIFNYWTIVLHLLKLGIPWEAITNFSDAEINIVLGVESAYQQKENDDQARQMASHKMPSMPNMPNF